jgi:hypothetical protein
MKRFSWLFILLLFFLLFSACGKLSRKGTAPANVAPEVFLVNVPPDLVNFSTLAKIYWYGFDQDGYISKYQYLVIPDTGNLIPKSGGYIDPAFVQTIERVSPGDWNDSSLSRILGINRAALHSVDSVRTPVGTWDNVMLTASLDTTAYLAQYFFVRGVDNEGAVSKILKPDSPKGSNFRLFTRTNRPPVTAVSYAFIANVTESYVDTTSYVDYCLPETTLDWKGIRVSWSAQDPDYGPRTQPAFSYYWQLLGPFPDTLSIDTTKVYYSSWDSKEGIPWVDSTSRLLVNLVNAPGKDYGWYQFRVRARDDAFVPDPTPAKVTFRIIKPPFLFSNEKSVLLVDATDYRGIFIIPKKDLIRNFYTGILDTLKAHNKIDSYHFCRVKFGLDATYPVPEDTLSHYKLVIYFNEGRFSGIVGTGSSFGADTGFVQIERYLRVGGRVWMIGQNNWDVAIPSTPSFVPINSAHKSGFTDVVVRLANYFFGVTGIFMPAFDSQRRNEEMIAAEPWDSTYTGLPRLEVDTTKLTSTYYSGIPATKPLMGIARANYEGIWNANYNKRIYTAISYKDPALSLIHGRPCASRAYGPNPVVFTENGQAYTLQWKAAEFCFPAFPMKKEQMTVMMEKMVEWFMKEGLDP